VSGCSEPAVSAGRADDAPAAQFQACGDAADEKYSRGLYGAANVST